MGTKGQRSDIEMNAFWAAAAAMTPVTAPEDKLSRAVMCILDFFYEPDKRAIELRNAIVDTAAGWKLIKTKPHCDRTDWTLLKKKFHSDEVSKPDNDHMSEIQVNVTDDGGTCRTSSTNKATGMTTQIAPETRSPYRRCSLRFRRRTPTGVP